LSTVCIFLNFILIHITSSKKTHTQKKSEQQTGMTQQKDNKND